VLVANRKRRVSVAAANRTLKETVAFFRWAHGADLIEGDPPTKNVKKAGKVAERDRVLTDAEIAKFWTATDQMGWPFAPLLKILLLTGQRKEEVGQMAWAEIEGDVWTIPASRAKNGKAHAVALSPQAMAIIEVMPRTGPLVFSMTDRPPVAYGNAKAKLDRFMGDGVPHWIIHDLRRTATTHMAELGIPPHVVDKILNHTSGTIRGVARIYNKFEYVTERRAALAAWGRKVETIVGPDDGADNVVPMARAR
jgi:integrase